MVQVGLVRTAIFVPGNRPERVDKAMLSAADAVILDLEDSVPPDEKPSTRAIVREKALQYQHRRVFIRVNSLGSGFLDGDLDEIIVPGINCIGVPKVDEPEQMSALHTALLDLETKRGIPEGRVSVIPFIESGRALENSYRILSEEACRQRFFTAAFGAADYTLDMGVEMTGDARELDFARARIGVACKAAGVARPLDTPYMIDIHDLDGLRADAVRAKQAGFQGKLCIHPKQLDVCNEVFSPSQVEIDRARRAIEAFKEAESQGRGAVQFEGMMVDYPVVRRFMAIVELSEQLERQ